MLMDKNFLVSGKPALITEATVLRHYATKLDRHVEKQFYTLTLALDATKWLASFSGWLPLKNERTVHTGQEAESAPQTVWTYSNSINNNSNNVISWYTNEFRWNLRF
jgi:hypothetical protein